MSRLRELRVALGGPAQVARKACDAAVTARNLFSRSERLRRLELLCERGELPEVPTGWQLVVGAQHMMFQFILPSNLEFYAHYAQSHHWQQLLRFLDEPSAMMDPIGLGISRDMLISHLVQVVHTSAGYDVALLDLFPDGLDALEAELRALVAGTHPRQAALDAILERPDYAERLLAAVGRYREDPVANWRVDTFDAPADCSPRFEWGIERFGSPGRLLRYALTLPATPLESMRGRAAGPLADGVGSAR